MLFCVKKKCRNSFGGHGRNRCLLLRKYITVKQWEIRHRVVRSPLHQARSLMLRIFRLQICVNAVMAVADMERKDVNFDMIKVDGKPGGELGDTELIRGIVIDKEMSHPQMPKEIKVRKMLFAKLHPLDESQQQMFSVCRCMQSTMHQV